jgi:hypothetical protein
MRIKPSFAVAVAVCLITSSAYAQFAPTYSVDIQSSSVPGFNDEGDIYTPVGAGNFPPPAVVVPNGLLGLGINPAGLSELDALSYGTEPYLLPGPLFKHSWTFSVDEYAVGRAGVPGPSVTTEGAFGAQEAAADIYASITPAGPFLPFPGTNAGLYDGNGGFTPFAAPGLNLREPNQPLVNAADAGDNLDAWDLDQAVAQAVPGTVFNVPIYFSLDTKFLDPLDAPYNSGSAQVHGFVGGDVLLSLFAGGAPSLFAAAAQLGLDKAGADTDDLDALVLAENNDGAYTPPTAPYSWVGGATDMLLFSVRRGSAVIGTADSLLGLPIEEGDILMPPVLPGGAPGIFVPAEALGLATFRTNGGATFQGFGDDLDALDVQQIGIPEPASCVLLAGCVVGLLTRRK